MRHGRHGRPEMRGRPLGPGLAELTGRWPSPTHLDTNVQLFIRWVKLLSCLQPACRGREAIAWLIMPLQQNSSSPLSASPIYCYTSPLRENVLSHFDCFAVSLLCCFTVSLLCCFTVVLFHYSLLCCCAGPLLTILLTLIAFHIRAWP